MARVIVCVNCSGKGYIVKLAGDGYRYPEVCRACDGTGKQEVWGT